MNEHGIFFLSTWRPMKPRAYGAISVLLLGVLLSAITTAAEPTPVSVQLEWRHQFEFAGFYAAKEKGFYREAGLQVELREYHQGQDVISDVLNGHSTFGVFHSVVIQARLQGRPLRLLAAYLRHSPLLIAAKPGIFLPSDLRGKRLMADAQEIKGINLLTMFNNFGMSIHDMDLVPHEFNIKSFAQGKVDAMTIYQTNELYHLYKQGIKFNLIDPNIYAVPLLDQILFTSEHYLSQHPDTVRAFVAATNRGWRYALEHPAEIIEFIRKRYNSQHKSRDHLLFEAHQMHSIMLPEIYPVGTINPKQLDRIQELFIQSGRAEEKLPIHDILFDTALGPAANDTPRQTRPTVHSTTPLKDAVIHLTPSEIAWLEARNRVLRYCYHPRWKPYDFEENGIHQGIFRGYLDLFSHKLGITFKPVTTDTWQDALQAAQERRCDFISGAVNTPQRRSYLDFTSAYFDISNVLIALNDTPFIPHISSILDKTIAVPKDAAIKELLHNKYPQLHLLDYDKGIPQLKQLLEQGKAYAGITGLEYAAEIIRNNPGRYRIIGKLDETDPIAIAVRNDRPALLHIMQKAVDSLTQAERDAIGKRWTKFTIEESVDYRRLWQILAFFSLIGLLLLYRQRQLKRFNHQLLRAKEQAEAANKVKSLFLANMSHEIRTPLNAVINLAQFGLDSEIPTKVRLYFQGIADSGHLLLGIINEILDYSKLESGKMPLENVDFDIADTVKQAIAVVCPLVRSKQLKFHVILSPDIRGCWRGDAQKIKQVLVNLLGNAVKFTHEGSITVDVSLQSNDAETSIIRFQVSDTGIGIDKEKIADLFQVFQQADASTTRKYGGTGLGLSIVRKLVELMNGEIQINSQPGKGSTFYFDLPLQRRAQATSSPAKASITCRVDESPNKPLCAKESQIHILVAEDNKLNQIIIAELLQNLAVEFDLADNGRQVIQLLETHPERYAAILMDVQMPEMDGFEATRRIRAMPQFAKLPIIAITAHALDSDRSKCHAAGMNDFIAKPFDQEQFRSVLKNLIPLPAADTALDTKAVFNPEAAMQWTDGDQALYNKIAEQFMQTYTDRIEVLKGDPPKDALKSLLHDLKSNARVVGAETLSEQADAAELCLTNGGRLESQTRQEIINALQQLLEQLHHYLQKNPASEQHTDPPP